MKRFTLYTLFVFVGMLPFQSDSQDNMVIEMFEKAVLKIQQNDLDSADYYYQNIIEYKKANEPENLIHVYFHIGATYRRKFHPNLALNYLLLAEEVMDTIEVNMKDEDIYNEIGLVYYDKKEFNKTLFYYKKALDIAYSINDSVGLAAIHNNIGLVFVETQDYTTALDYFSKVLIYATDERTDHTKANALNNLGIIHYQLENYTKSIFFLEQAKVLTETKLNNVGMANIQFNMGLSNSDLENYTVAKQLFIDAKKGYETEHNTSRILYCDVQLYRTEYILGNKQIAKEYETKALIEMDSTLDIAIKIDLYSYLAENYLSEGDSAKALLYNLHLVEEGKNLIILLNDAQLMKLKTDVNFLNVKNELDETQYSFEKVQSENTEINHINSLLKNRNKWILILSILGLIVTSGFIIILLKANRKKRTLNKTLEEQRNNLDKKNKEILTSVDYANSMEKLLLQQMNPHFIFNALTTIEASIAVGDSEFAKNYISQFASLLRQTLDYSRQESISLMDEIDFLKAYINLNKVKQGNNFSYEIIYDIDKVDDFVNTPPMLVQPFIENALIHGLYHKVNGEKHLSITIEPMDDYIFWIIEDNGVGRKKSKEIGKTHKGISHGIKITSDRIKWMENIYGNHFSIVYEDLTEGTKVVLKTPIVDG